MNAPMLQPVSRKLDGTKILPAETSALTRLVADMNCRAVNLAQSRLTALFPGDAVSHLQEHFSGAACFKAEQRAASAALWSIDRILQDLCRRVHPVAWGKKADGLQIGLNGLNAAPGTLDIGDPVEPRSDLYVLEPRALRAAAEANASIEIRLFDRQLPEWAAVADDFAAVSGADVFMKLFIAGGEISVNGWHRDSSDVFATVLDGRKRFQIGTATCSEDAPVCDVDALLAPGDALLIPRSRLHNATPTKEPSALLSVGLMRRGDWAYRGESPSHLRLTSANSSQLYRLALRSHVPAAWRSSCAIGAWRSRTPGGVGIVRESDTGTTFVADGKLFEAEMGLANALAVIHGTSRITITELIQRVGRSEAWCIAAVSALGTCGLIQVT